MNDREMIEFWKANERPFGLCPEEARKWMIRFSGPLQQYDVGEWAPAFSTEPGDCHPDNVIRIPADYEPEKQARWVECGVFIEDNAFYAFKPAVNCSQRKVGLFEAPGMVGFGGVRYEGLPGWRQLGYETNKTAADSEPVKPVAVRFWVEETK